MSDSYVDSDEELRTPKSPNTDRLFRTEIDTRRRPGFMSQDAASVTEFSTDPSRYNSSLSSVSTDKDSRSATEFRTTNRSSVKRHNKDVSEFAGLTLQQEIVTHNTIWAMRFSPDGCLLAVAGDAGFMAVYLVSLASEPLGRHLTWLGHNMAVVELAWCSSSTHILSASMDRTVMLWSMDQERPLMTFQHPDIVSSVKFHPFDANFFISGSFDRNIRVWSIPNARVEASVQALDLVTCVNYSQNGSLAFAGLLHGRVVVYNCPSKIQLKFVTTLSCRNRKGLKKYGKKVTGLELMDDSHLLVTTNDSRLRLFSLQDFSVKQKYKGHVNECGPIRATFSQNLLHLVCSSDNGEVFIWNVFESQAPRFKPKIRIFKRDRNTAYEHFRVSKNKTATCALFAPSNFVRSLQEYFSIEGRVVSHVLVTADNDCYLKVFFNTFSET